MTKGDIWSLVIGCILILLIGYLVVLRKDRKAKGQGKRK